MDADVYLLANTKYATLLSRGFTPDPVTAFSRGEYHNVEVRVGNHGPVVYSHTSKGKPLSVFDIIFTTSQRGPFIVYLTLFWAVPGKGEYRIVLRIGAPKPAGKAGPGFVFSLTTVPYESNIRNGYALLKKRARRASSGAVVSSVRPNEHTYQVIPTVHTWTANGGGITTGTVTRDKHVRTWSGVRTPGFWTKRKGELPVNDHQVTIVETNDSGLVELWHRINSAPFDNDLLIDSYTLHYSAPGTPSVSYSGTTSADYKAFARLTQRMGSNVINLAQDLGEYHETIGMVTKTANRIRHAVVALRHGNVEGAAAALWTGKRQTANQTRSIRGLLNRRAKAGAEFQSTRNLAENWLELQYGWKPLLSDLHDAIERLSQRAAASNSVAAVRSSGSSVIRGESTFPLWQDSSKVAGKRVQTRIDTIKYGLRFSVSDSQRAYWAQTGFTNPVDLTWELLPYSFVVDWFLPVGPWLESFSNFQGLKFIDGYKVHYFKRVTIDELHFDGVANGANNYWQVAGGLQETYVYVKREKLTSFPSLPLPVFKSPFSVGHALNALALMRASFGFSSHLHV